MRAFRFVGTDAAEFFVGRPYTSPYRGDLFLLVSFIRFDNNLPDG